MPSDANDACPFAVVPADVQEEMAFQASIDRSLTEAAEGASVSNASIADAMLRGSAVNADEMVIVLKFSRNPAAFHDLLGTSDDLKQCRVDLESHGFSWRLPSRAYIFVKLHQYEATTALIEQDGLELSPAHVIVAQDYESIVMELMLALPRKHKIYMESRSEMAPEQKSTSMSSMGAFPVLVKRSFIHIVIPSSLHSAPSDAQRTMSTTDATPSKGSNPRKATKGKKQVSRR